MKSRAEAVRLLDERDARLRALLAELSPEALTAPATIGGGEWSAKDLVAHLGLWEHIALRGLDLWRAGALPPRGEPDEINAEGQARNAGLDLDAVLARYDATHARLLAAIQAMSEEDWDEKRSRDEHEFSLGELLGGMTGGPNQFFDHADAHLPDLEAYVASTRAST